MKVRDSETGTSAVWVTIAAFAFLCPLAIGSQQQASEMTVRDVQQDALVLETGERVLIPGVHRLPIWSQLLKDTVNRPIERDDQGRIYGRVRIYCGGINDEPISTRVEKIDLGRMIQFLGQADHATYLQVPSTFREGISVGGTFLGPGWVNREFLAFRRWEAWLSSGKPPSAATAAPDASTVDMPREPNAPGTLPPGAIRRIGIPRQPTRYCCWPLAFSPNGQLLATEGPDAMIRLWDAKSGQLTHEFGPHGAGFTSTFFSPGGDELITCGGSWVVRWRIADQSEILSLAMPTEPHYGSLGMRNHVRGACLSSDGITVLTAHHDAVRAWRGWRGTEILSPSKIGEKLDQLFLIGGFLTVVYAPQGQHFLTARPDFRQGMSLTRIIVCDEESAEVDNEFEIPGTLKSNAFSFSPDGVCLVSAFLYGGQVGFWDIRSGEQTKTLLPRGERTDHLAFSRDGMLLASASYVDSSIQVWEVNTGRELACLSVSDSSGVAKLAFSPTDNTLASLMKDQTVILWDIDAIADRSEDDQ